MKHHSEREAASTFGITRSVLQRWKRRDRDTIPKELSQGSIKPVFTEDQENTILKFVFELAERFYAMTRKSLAELAFNLAEANQLKHKFKDGIAGEDWVASFLERHCDVLSPRTGTPLSLIRITEFTKKNVYRFFDQLEDIIARKGYLAEQIYNVDETGLSVVASRPPAVLARRGVRSVPVLVSVERGQLVTFTCAANAQGRFIPPMFVLPKSSRYVDTTSAPIGSLFFKTSKGWSTTDAFCRWLKHFRIHAAENCRTPILLILDNHSSHISYLAVKYCMENNIELLTLPPHT
ncbi:unnamed protein product, partial [Allacma fusca]